MKNKSALLAGILSGMASPSSIYADSNYPRLSGSDMERMRSDVARIGADFSKVIERENGQEQTTARKPSSTT